jgi:hypothetical protein
VVEYEDVVGLWRVLTCTNMNEMKILVNMYSKMDAAMKVRSLTLYEGAGEQNVKPWIFYCVSCGLILGQCAGTGWCKSVR